MKPEFRKIKIIKNGIVLFQVKNILKNYLEYLKNTRCFVVWNKLAVTESMSFSMCELLWTSFDSPAKVFTCLSPGKKGFFIRESVRIHPTQKPVALYKWLLSKCAKPGWEILDTHFGSGSIAVACNELGFNLTASEIDEDYFNAACKRIEEANRQGDLFVEAGVPCGARRLSTGERCGEGVT
jgi:site-specific DNA-methyltransferase (adenine-specific)